MGEVIQLQGDQRKDVQEFLVDKKEGLELDAKTIKVCWLDDHTCCLNNLTRHAGTWLLSLSYALSGHLNKPGRITYGKPPLLLGRPPPHSKTVMGNGVY